MRRSYQSCIEEYLNKKIVLIMGPRQCGKTTLAKMLQGQHQYINFDSSEDRSILREKSWDRSKDLLILDEVHKMHRWKQWLKGVYDTEGNRPSLVVTGSARLDMHKRVGDSLAGRYFSYRLHPLDLRELSIIRFRMNREDILARLLSVGGFPEPFLEGSTRFYNLWKRSHLDIILRQDLVDYESVRDIRSMEILIDLLRERVGSPISYSSLAEDLQRSDKTVKKWLEILENMYIVFKVVPFHKNIARSKLKQPKYYFYDIGQVGENKGARLENLVACSLLKEVQFRQDCLGETWGLSYLSAKGGQEIDFLITSRDLPYAMVEVKYSDSIPSKSFTHFANQLESVKKVQIVKELKKEKTYPNGTEVRRLADWLCKW